MNKDRAAGPAVLTLYTRAACHLCLDIERALARLRREFDFQLVVEDVDRDPGWQQLYGDKVPVLMIGDVQFCHYRLDEARLRRYLESR